MQNVYRALGVAAVIFLFSVAGMALQGVIAPADLTAARPSVGAMTGLATLLLALVLGLVIWTAFAVYTTQLAEAQALAPVVIELDVAMEKYGPEAAVARRSIRDALGRSRKRFFGDAAPRPFTYEETRNTLHGISDFYDTLSPANDAQRELLTHMKALSGQFAQARMRMARLLVAPVPNFLLTVVICWSAALFFGNGLIAAINAVTVLAHLAGSIAIGSAIFLILELSQPYTGVFRLSSAGIDGFIKALDETLAK